jgi:hypothetical protein
MGCTNLSGHLDLKTTIQIKGAAFRGCSKISSISMSAM